MCIFLKDKLQLAEAVARRCSAKKVFLKVSQNLQKNLLCWIIFIFGDFTKKCLQQWRIFGSFVNFLRTPILLNTWERLLLSCHYFLEVSRIFEKIFKSSNEQILLLYIIYKQIFLIIYIVSSEIL